MSNKNDYPLTSKVLTDYNNLTEVEIEKYFY